MSTLSSLRSATTFAELVLRWEKWHSILVILFGRNRLFVSVCRVISDTV